MVHKSYTLNFCLEEWFINRLIHVYQYKILLRLFHHFSFDSCCSYWILVYFRFVLHLSLFRCVSHFSIFCFVSHFSIFRLVSISFRSLVQPVLKCCIICRFCFFFWFLVYFLFVLLFCIFRCVSHFSIFRFVAFRFAF
jgi:hypothetical protein